MTFEECVRRLEEIVRELEEDEVPLDKALALFEEGVTRLRDATAELSRAEEAARVLREQVDGTFDTPEFRA
ncbi:MAG TPA: exodeoxyribonuclease VII small subunit [Gemmatimonadaceae bacterium]